MSKYQVINGTAYDARTDAKLVQVLENVRLTGKRVRVWFGDTVTGAPWCEENDVVGTLSRSSGGIKIPLLVANSRSLGGGILLERHIVHIVDTKTKQVLYSHKLFKMPIAKVVATTWRDALDKGCTHTVLLDGGMAANFKSEAKAQRYADFMAGKRMGK